MTATRTQATRAGATPGSTRLPFVVSIPHGSLEIPADIAGRLALDDAAVFADADPYTADIYDIGDAVEEVLTAQVARAVVDLNRAPEDRPPENPDGVVKTRTCHDVAVWRSPSDPSEDLTDALIARWWRPYHELLVAASCRPGVVAGLDCHSMAATAPPIAPDTGGRPLFCVSDRDGTSAPPSFTAVVAAALAEAFEVDPARVARNRPFLGGGIVARHGMRPVPWVQVEMNRRLYLADPWFDPGTRTVDPTRLEDLRARFAHALEVVADRSGEGGI